MVFLDVYLQWFVQPSRSKSLWWYDHADDDSCPSWSNQRSDLPDLDLPAVDGNTQTEAGFGQACFTLNVQWGLAVWVNGFAGKFSAMAVLIVFWDHGHTVSGLVKEADKAYMRGTDSQYNRQFTRSIADVNTEQLVAAGKR